MAAKTKSVWERRARTAEKDLETLRTEVVRLHAQLTESQESRDRYARDLMQERNMNRDLREQMDGQLAQVQALREQVNVQWTERYEAWKAGQRVQAALQTPQTAPQTCRCSEHEERLRALLERVVSLESRMNAVSAAADAGTPF